LVVWRDVGIVDGIVVYGQDHAWLFLLASAATFSCDDV
jgi:hypothetical protein